MTESRPTLTAFFAANAPLALLGLAHVPFAVVYFISLWQFEHYQFYPFAIAAFVWLYVLRGDRGVIRPGWIGWMAISLDILVLLFAATTNWIQPTMVAVTLYCFAVTRGTREWEYPIPLTRLTLLPMLLIRPPSKMDTFALQWLQESTTGVASRILDSTNYLHLRRGNIIELPEKQFLVEEACSGVQSLFTVLFLAAFIVCWQRRSLLQALFLFVAGFIYAGAMNVLRISSIVVAWQNWELDLSHGWQHDALGYVALLTAVILLLSTDRLLHFLFAPFNDHTFGPFTGVYSNPIIAAWNFVCGGRLLGPQESATTRVPAEWILVASLLFTVSVGGLQVLVLYMGGAGRFDLPESSLALFEEDMLPSEIEGFSQVSYGTESRPMNSSWGSYSNTWQFRGHGMSVVISCDHPFRNWHYLDVCYIASGWRVFASRELKDDPDWPSLTFAMTDDRSGRHGRVVYSLFAANGKPMSPVPLGLSTQYLVQRIRQRAAGGIGSLIAAPEDNVSYQIQLSAEAGQPLTEEQFTKLRELHRVTRSILHGQYASTQLNQTLAATE